MTLQERRNISVAFSKVIANFQQYFDKQTERKPESNFWWCLLEDFSLVNEYIIPCMIYDCLRSVKKSDRETRFMVLMMTRNFITYNEKRVKEAFHKSQQHLENA